MGCRVTTPPRSAFGECGNSGRKTVEWGGPKAVQIGRFLHVSGFRGFFDELQERGIQNDRVLVFQWLFSASCRREGEGDNELQERGRRGGRGKRIWDEDRSKG